MDKQTVKTVISQLLGKALQAVVKIIRTKLLPKVVNRYCKALQSTTEKLVERVDILIDKIPSITDAKKLVRALYVLRLVQETTSTVGKALITLADMIGSQVDFSVIDEPKTDEIASEVASLEVIANADTDEPFGGCGPDGCEIV